jgi:hypothetical protein
VIWLVAAGVVVLSLYLLTAGSEARESMSDAWIRRFIGETPHDGRARDSWGSK